VAENILGDLNLRFSGSKIITRKYGNVAILGYTVKLRLNGRFEKDVVKRSKVSK
jgi:hypothetical protein